MIGRVRVYFRSPTNPFFLNRNGGLVRTLSLAQRDTRTPLKVLLPPGGSALLPAFQSLFTRHIDHTWGELNRRFLQGRLQTPVFALSETTKTLGTWNAETRTLSIAVRLFLERSAFEIEEVIKHEMAHQYADEVLKARQVKGETPHGSGFRYACSLLEIQHSARLNLTSKTPPVLLRIRKLLALAESHNVYEAEAAMSKAKDLMERYEMDLGIQDHDFQYRLLGQPRKQKNAVEQFIATLLVRFFHVKLVWIPSEMVPTSKRVWLMEVNGTRTNLEVATYVYDYLKRELEWLWRDQRARRPHWKGKGPKRDFQLGVLKGFMAKLDQSETPMASKSKELVRLKSAKLDHFFTDRHPDLRSGRRMTYRENETYREGFKEGQNLDIRPGLKGEPPSDSIKAKAKRITSGSH